jgi:hypothetical protein
MVRTGHVWVASIIAVVICSFCDVAFAETAQASSSETQEVISNEHTGLPPAYFWIGVSGTLVSAALATGLGSWALSMRTTVRETDARARTFEQLDRINRVALLTDVFWGIAGAFAIAAIVLGVLTEWRDDDVDTTSSRQIWLQPTMNGLALGGVL